MTAIIPQYPLSSDKLVVNDAIAVSGTGQYTAAIWVEGGKGFTVEMSGGAGNTYVVQRWDADAVEWQTVATLTTFAPKHGEEVTGAFWRIGCTVYAAAARLSIQRGAWAGDNLTASAGGGSSDITSVIPGTGATNLGKAEDGQHASGDVGVMALAVVKATPTGTSATADDYAGLTVDGVGKQYVNDGDVANLTTTPTVTAGAYTTGQVVGGLISLASAVRNTAGAGKVVGVNIGVKTALTAAYDVLFFHTNPTNSTFTDNSALAVNVADLPFLAGIAHCNDLTSLGTPQNLQALNVNIPFKLAATTLYAVIVIRGGQTFASTSAVILNVEVEQR